MSFRNDRTELPMQFEVGVEGLVGPVCPPFHDLSLASLCECVPRDSGTLASRRPECCPRWELEAASRFHTRLHPLERNRSWSRETTSPRHSLSRAGRTASPIDRKHEGFPVC